MLSFESLPAKDALHRLSEIPMDQKNHCLVSFSEDNMVAAATCCLFGDGPGRECHVDGDDEGAVPNIIDLSRVSRIGGSPTYIMLLFIHEDFQCSPHPKMARSPCINRIADGLQTAPPCLVLFVSPQQPPHQ